MPVALTKQSLVWESPAERQLLKPPRAAPGKAVPWGGEQQREAAGGSAYGQSGERGCVIPPHDAAL